MYDIDDAKSGEAREQFFLTLYQKAFPAVAQYISTRGGTFEEAKDVFQDALLLYYEHILKSDDRQVQNEQGYLLGIARHLWLKKFRKEQSSSSLEYPEADQLIEEEAQETASSHKLLLFLEAAGKKCMDMLRAFYYDRQPLSDIARSFGYSGIRSATVQKYKCIEKVRDTVKEKSMQYEDFLE